MRRFPCVLATALVAVAVLPPAAMGKGFTYGVTAGEVTSSSAIVWTRSDKTGNVVLRLSDDKRFGDADDKVKTLKATAARDNTVQTKLTRLRSGKLYYYRFNRGGSTSSVGRFETAPASNQARNVTFALSGDADALPAPGMTSPFWGSFDVYKRMAAEGNDFNVNMGDTIYSDTEVYSASGQPDPPPALTVAEKWGKYKLNLAMKNLQALRKATGLYSQWDDHEFINDFSRPENGSSVYKNGVRAFRDYSPVTYTSKLGIYRKMRWGRHLELFFLDERSFRDAKADDACINPETGQPDFAPTAPQSTRNTFSVLAPSLAQPVSQQCLDTIRSQDRTFLGKPQIVQFLKDVKRSSATFKVIVNELPIQMIYALPYDRWEGYEAERQSVLQELQDVKNVVFLSTDVHATLVNDARFKTLEEGGPVDSGMLDVATGPVGTRTFENQIDDATGKEGAGDAATAAFFKPPPPNGLGMQCAASDAYSYVQVTVSGKQLMIEPKFKDGKPLTEEDGAACGPFEVKVK